MLMLMNAPRPPIIALVTSLFVLIILDPSLALVVTVTYPSVPALSVKILMNVPKVMTDAMTTHHVSTLSVHIHALAILATVDLELSVLI